MEKGRLRFFDNPAFMRYVEGLPEQSHRVLLVPGQNPADDMYLSAASKGGGPPDASCEPRTENNEK
jgi:hypothetical protein